MYFRCAHLAFVAMLPFATALAFDASAAVTTPTGKLLTCQQMEDNCLKFAHRSVMAAGPNATIPYNTSANACYDSFRQATNTGVWPANPPFSFALKCTN